MQDSRIQLAPGMIVQNRYEIVRLLGRGGMGAVYEAIDRRLGHRVALKHLTGIGDHATRFFAREARLLAGLRHPALPKVTDYFADADGQFLVMEFIPGDDLATLIARHGASFPLERVLMWADQLLGALDYLHKQQPPVIHHDIKPQNLKLTPHGEIILLDFGLARGIPQESPDLSTITTVGYTPQYASLEQIKGGTTDPRSDLYALAATLYHLLTGDAPVDVLTRAAKVLYNQPDPLQPAHERNPVVPATLGAALGQALSLNPDARPPSAAAMRSALQAARYNQTIENGGQTLGAPTAHVPLSANGASSRVFISYKHDIKLDEQLVKRLQSGLQLAGYSVFTDQMLPVGVEWANTLQQQIENCDFMIVLLSAASIHSEMVAKEVEFASQQFQRIGRPRLLPVRVNFTGSLPYQLSLYLDHLHYAELRGKNRNARHLVAQLINAMRRDATLPLRHSTQAPTVLEARHTTTPKPSADPRFLDSLVDPGGAVRLRSDFYIDREDDDRLRRELNKAFGTTTTIRAPRQTGKSSLLVRGIAHAQQQGSRAVFIDLQLADDSVLQSLDRFLRYFTAVLLTKLRLDPTEVDWAWNTSLGASDKATYLIEDYVLSNAESKIVLAIDEADRLLGTPFHNTFFGLLRSWHNNRSLNELWDKLDIVMVVSTEPHLLIQDLNQSPFNVGLKIRLEDFNLAQVQELNRRYRLPLNEREAPALFDFLNGHPYLTSRALYTMLTEGLSWERLTRLATMENSPFGDHLRRYLWMLREDGMLRDALKQIIATNTCPEEQSFYRLQQAGLIKGNDITSCTCRCKLYEAYLKDKL
jgi:serine/threonine protein kinase